MSDSILTSTKKVLGITEDYTVFDQDIILFINAVFSTLNQLGLGPSDGFAIEDESDNWSDFIGNDPRLNNVKTYVYLRTRILFDPPATSYLLTALDTQVKELEWRMNVYREGTDWVDPDPIGDDEDYFILDGGSPQES